MSVKTIISILKVIQVVVTTLIPLLEKIPSSTETVGRDVTK